MDINKNIAQELNVSINSVSNTVKLLIDGATIPFIARYRKEKTNNLDETQIKNIKERFDYYIELEKRKKTILQTIKEQNKLTPDLERKIICCVEKQELEDIYLPYKPKKRNRATIAKEKGLEPLADLIFNQIPVKNTREKILEEYVDLKKGVNNPEEALAGALDIIAERISDMMDIRKYLREIAYQAGKIISKVKKDFKDQKTKFEMYYDFSEFIKKSASHRILAIRRGEKEGILSFKLEINEENALHFIDNKIIKNNNFIFYNDLLNAINDAYKRLIFPSIETEVLNLKIEEAEKEAINVFSKNLKNLLLFPPAGSKMVLALDPGFRTGCKIAIIDKNGNFLEYKAIFPHEPQNKKIEAEVIILDFIKKYNIELISIGNGTASKESSIFINDVIKRNKLNIKSVIVNEAGASVYSASAIAIKEFPDLDVTVRGAISIGRRLQDPLAELVKIDPKSIGIGQYQHDVNQMQLKNSLDLTVESAVNYVGVELNTASAELLSYISGIGNVIAQNIIKFRKENNMFKNRKQLLNVTKLGNKAFEQCAGFLRIRDSENPLDNSSIHPESYHIVEKMAEDLKVKIENLLGNKELISKIKIQNYVNAEVGFLTLQDIILELQKPSLDPRKEFSNLEFSSEINEIDDLQEGMELEGIVTNVTNFGAFIDIGVHQDGLIHISKLSNEFISNPHDIVSVGDKFKVRVISVDKQLKRISLEKIL